MIFSVLFVGIERSEKFIRKFTQPPIKVGKICMIKRICKEKRKKYHEVDTYFYRNKEIAFTNEKLTMNSFSYSFSLINHMDGHEN